MKIRKIGLIFGILMSAFSGVQAQNSATLDVKPTSVVKIELGAKSPNELPSYKFFGEGRLNELKLGISTKKDVDRVFGTPLRRLNNSDVYNYGSEWLILFRYYDEAKLVSIAIPLNLQIPRGKNIKWVPEPKFIGRLYSISLYPKKITSFNEIAFSGVFNKKTIPVIDSNAKGIMHYYYNSYQDDYGLEYQIFGGITYSDPERKDRRKTGQLMSIEYNIPSKLEQSFFVIQK